MSYPSDKTRLKELRGMGELEDYKPFINARDFNSIGTCEIVPDWITGRSVELLSQGEAIYWYILRFNPDIVDIREQYPMNPNETLALADTLGIRHVMIDVYTRMILAVGISYIHECRLHQRQNKT